MTTNGKRGETVDERIAALEQRVARLESLLEAATTKLPGEVAPGIRRNPERCRWITDRGARFILPGCGTMANTDCDDMSRCVCAPYIDRDGNGVYSLRTQSGRFKRDRKPRSETTP